MPRNLRPVDVDEVALSVVPRGFRTVSVVLGPGRGLATVPVAVVLPQGARELDPPALRRLADALLAGGAVPGVAVAGVLVAAVAAHDVLAKLIYAAPAAHAELAGQLIYYGAAPVHLALFVLLGREWFAGQERARRRAARPVVVTT